MLLFARMLLDTTSNTLQRPITAIHIPSSIKCIISSKTTISCLTKSGSHSAMVTAANCNLFFPSFPSFPSFLLFPLSLVSLALSLCRWPARAAQRPRSPGGRWCRGGARPLSPAPPGPVTTSITQRCRRHHLLRQCFERFLW